MDLNRITILGRLTRDPEMRTTPNGKSVTSMTVATGRSWTDQSGVKQEKTEFHNCVLWGRLGEVASQYLAKGRRVYVEGRVETRSWDAQDGTKKYRTELIAENMIMLDGPRGGGNSGSNNDPFPSDDSAPMNNDDSQEIKVEDIPF